MRILMRLLTGFLLTTVAPLAAQDVPPRAVSEAGAGLYFGGTRQSLSGPMFFARRWVPLANGHVFIGGRFEFRDDDDSRGRAVSAGVGLEVAPTANLGPVRIQLPVHVGFEYVGVSRLPPIGLRPDATTGLHERLSFGTALTIRAGTSELLFELRRSVGSAGTFTAGTFGLRGRPAGDRGGVRLTANGLAPLSSGYEREPDFMGYTLVYQRPIESRLFDEFRGSLGIDFVDFTYSTGVISLLIGGAIDIASAPKVASLQVVTQVGAFRFVEPTGGGLEPAGAVGLEARLGPPGLSAIVGTSLIAASGPDGFLAAVQYRIGFGVGL